MCASLCPIRRSILRKEFVGKTGLVKFREDGARYGAKHDIVKVMELSDGRAREWQTVGSVLESKTSLLRDFWNKEIKPSLKNTIRVVLIEEEPLLSKEAVGKDQKCILTHSCTEFVNFSKNKSNPYSVKPVKFCCRGFLINVLHWLERDLNVRADVYLVKDGKFGAYDQQTGQWNGMVKDLIDGEADMALTSLTISESRAKVVDFSYPFLYGQTKVVISTRDTAPVYGLGFRFLDPFDSDLWLVTLLHIVVIWFIVWYLERKSPYGHHGGYGRENDFFSFAVCMSYVWSNFFKLQLEDGKPRSLSVRLTTAVFSFSALILTTSYTANLAASLVRSEEENSVSGITDPKVRQIRCACIFHWMRSHRPGFP